MAIYFKGKRFIRAIKITQDDVFYLLQRENGVCRFPNYCACICLADAFMALSGGGRARDVTCGESSVQLRKKILPERLSEFFILNVTKCSCSHSIMGNTI